MSTDATYLSPCKVRSMNLNGMPANQQKSPRMAVNEIRTLTNGIDEDGVEVEQRQGSPLMHA